MTSRIANFGNSNSSKIARSARALKAAVYADRPGDFPQGMPLAEALEQRQMLSTSYFVSPSGSNENAGTLAAPFQTIQAAANVAQPGDHVEIEAGTYRETVTPVNSGTAAYPIVYEAYDGQSVTISGADVLNTWTNTGGNIYQTYMPEDLGEGNNEVFVNGQAMIESRFPNTTLDLSHPTLATADSVTLGTNSATIYDSALTQPANYWVGAIIHMTPGQAWEGETGTVTSSAPGQVTISYTPISSWELPNAGMQFYLTGTFKELDGPGQWYRDPTTGELYLWTPTGNDPNDDNVEVKARTYAFVLDNRSDITIQGINIFAATIHTNAGSADTVLDGITDVYTNQYLSMPTGWIVPANSGLLLDGPDSVLENSTIAYSPGDGVYVNGAGSRIINNVIHDIDYDAGDSAGVRDFAPDSVVEDNTIYNTGRDGIRLEASGVEIQYNTIYDFGLQTTDSGGIYTVNFNGGGTLIACNDVYGAHSGGFGETGLYLDANSTDYIVHDNITADVDTGLKMNDSSQDNTIYDNTLGASEHSVYGNFSGDWNGSSFTDNVLPAAPQFGSGVVLTGNSAAAASAVGAAPFSSGANLATVASIPTDPNGGGSSAGGGSTASSGSGDGSTTTGTQTGSTTSGSSSSTGSGSSTTGTGSTTTGTGSGSTSTGSTGSTSSTTGTSSGSTTGSASGSTGSTGSSSAASGSSASGSSGGSATTGSGGGPSTGSAAGSSGSGGGQTPTGSGTDSTTTATGGSSAGTGATSTGSFGTSSSGSASTTGASTGSSSAGTQGTAGNSTGSTSAPAGSGSTTNTGTATSTGTSPPAPTTPPSVGSSPPPTAGNAPTLSDLLARVKTDRAEVRSDNRLRPVTLHQLRENKRADVLAYRRVKRELAEAMGSVRAVGSNMIWTNTIAEYDQQMQQLHAAVVAGKIALKSATQHDFSRKAREQLAADMKVVNAARKAA